MISLLEYLLALVVERSRVCWDGGEPYVVNCWPHVEMSA